MGIDISKFEFEEFVSTPDGGTFYFTGPKEFLPNPIIKADSTEIAIQFWCSLPNVYATRISPTKDCSDYDWTDICVDCLDAEEIQSLLSKVPSERRIKMTFDELKLEAKKYGYRLEKIQEPVILLPCPICGKKRTAEWYQQGGLRFRQCCNCGFTGNYGENSKEAKLEWNKTVEMYLEREMKGGKE